MATRRPIVNDSGQIRELPVGDVIAGGVFPFYKASGAVSAIPLTLGGALPFFKSSGVASNIALV